MEKTKPTIKDIAHEAGVSLSAVSLALNNRPGVSKQTKAKVLSIASNLGYAFSPQVHFAGSKQIVKVMKILRHGRTINNNHSVFIDAYIDGINMLAKDKGISLEIGTYGQEVPLETIAAQMLDSNQIMGYLVIATELSVEDIELLCSIGKCIVFMDTFMDFIPADFVVMNNTDEVFNIVKHLKDYGHRRIGMIKSSVKTQNYHLREIAFHQVMEFLGLPVNEEHIIDVDSTFSGAYIDMLRHLSGSSDLPTAFFAVNDIVALGCMKALQEKGFVIPDQISVVAFDNLPMAAMSNPPLSTIEVSKHEIGIQALRMLLLRIERKGESPPMKVLVSGNLVERESVKRLAPQ